MITLTGNRLGLLLSLMMVLAVLLYRETAIAIWGLWTADNNPTYSHGPLLLLVSLYILYQEWRQHAGGANLKVSYTSLVCLAGSGLLWFVAGLGSIQVIQMLALVATLCFILMSFLGFRQAKPYLFPVLLMVGALPVWGFLVKYLQTISAVAAGWITTATIKPSIREGMFIHIPAGTFEVTEGCSGIAYFIVSIILAVLFVYSNRIVLRKAPYFIVAAMFVAIVANIIRVYVIVLSGQLTDMQSYFVQKEHFSLGWVIFAIGISIALWQAGRFLPAEQTNSAHEKSQDSVNNSPLLVQQPVQWLNIALIILALAIGPIFAAKYRDDLSQKYTFSILLPEVVGNSNKVPYTDTYHPRIQVGDVSQEASYVNLSDDSKIYFYLNYFYKQSQGYEAVSDNNRLADGGNWRKLSNHVIQPHVNGYRDVRETRLQARNGEERVVWQWYETNGVRTGHDWLAKVQNIMGIIKGNPSIRMMMIAVELKTGLAEAQSQLRSFLLSGTGKFQVVRQLDEDQKE